jgi:hypothetical protein
MLSSIYKSTDSAFGDYTLKKTFSIEFNFSTEFNAKQAFVFINLHSVFGDYTLKLDYRIQC